LSCRGKISGTACCLIVGALALLHPELRYLPRYPTNIECQYFKSVPPVPWAGNNLRFWQSSILRKSDKKNDCHQKKPKLIISTSLGPNTLAINHQVPSRESISVHRARRSSRGYSAQSLGHLSEVRIVDPLSGISSHLSGSTESNSPDAMASIIVETPTTICWII